MKWIAILGLLAALSISSMAAAQNDLAATLEVLSGGVEMKRVNTSNWIAIRVEAVVGVGDVLRTDSSGRARITFFTDGTETEILPGTEYRINRFEGSATRFNLNAEVLVGQTIQRLSRLLDANSSYNITTPAMNLVARGTEFAIRVEESGRSAMLVQDGEVEADAEVASAAVPPGFGVRTAVGEPVSDVVRATTFDELDAALDGCVAALTTLDDVSLNVRSGASTGAERIGFIDASAITTLFGVTTGGGWYRIAFEDGFGWVLSSSAEIAPGCAGLRVFPDNFREGMSMLPTPTPTSAPSATPTPGS